MTTYALKKPLSSDGFSVSGQSCVGFGLGAFIGAGLNIGGGIKDDSANNCGSSADADKHIQAQIEGGALIVGGASISNDSGSFSPNIKGGLGVGGYVATMGCITKSWGLGR